MAIPHVLSRRKLLASALGLLSASIALDALPTPSVSATSSQPASLGKLVYVSDGNLWTKALPDGQPQQLTTDGHAFAPSWSPSGDWILYQGPKAAFLPQWWIMRADGTGTRRLDAIQASWSPRSDRIAFQTSNQQLRVQEADGTHDVLLSDAMSVGQVLDQYWRWSPDGDWMAVVSSQRVGFPVPYVGLWAVRSDGSSSRELVAKTNAENGLLVAGWTPDSKWILFSIDPSFSASYIADGLQWQAVPLDGAQAPQAVFASSVSDSIDLAQEVLRYDDYVSFSPDGRSMAVIRGGGREVRDGKALSIVDTTSGFQARDLTAPDVATGSPDWSRDGSTIAYTEQPTTMPSSSDASGVLGRRIWLINPDGSSRRRLTSNDFTED